MIYFPVFGDGLLNYFDIAVPPSGMWIDYDQKGRGRVSSTAGLRTICDLARTFMRVVAERGDGAVAVAYEHDNLAAAVGEANADFVAAFVYQLLQGGEEGSGFQSSRSRRRGLV